MTATAEPALWVRNTAHLTDDRLAGPRDPAWWFTGRRPEPGRCAGVEPDGRMTSLPMPDLSVCSREDVLDYFDNTWTLQETLFAGLQTAEAFYRPPEHNLRHPMIFYYGHPAVLYVNKLRVAGLLDDAVDWYLEQVLEVGVDEMSWDDMSKNEMSWPAVADVRDYRATVYGLVRDVVERTSFAAELGRPVTMDDRAWAVFLAFEHDRIHLETSSVLIRELPLRLVSPPEGWPEPAPMRRTTADGRPGVASTPVNDLVPVTGRTVRFGKPDAFPSFGWDNEYGAETHDVEDFEAAQFLVSNGEYHRFVADGGYRRPELWSEEGERWRRFRNTKWPRWWVPAGPGGLHAFRLRTTFTEIDMPWDWPVCVNFHEAKAFCAWRSQDDGRSYRLPTEAEFQLLRALPQDPAAADDPVLSDSGADMRARGVNLNLAWGSESPVDHGPANALGVHDSAGNLWSWSEDLCRPYDGFAVHPYYEDFTVPCFDGQHQMILGGAFISTGDQASIWARYHFRPHFLQQTGIRMVTTPIVPARGGASGAPGTGAPDTDVYATRPALDRYLLMHFGSEQETFGRTGHPLAGAGAYPQRLAAILRAAADRRGTPLRRVLDVGCAVGGASFALAGPTTEVIGVDRSEQFVETAARLARGEAVDYRRHDQGETSTRLRARATVPAGASIEFVVADGCDLPPQLGTFDGVIMANLLDRLGDPEACLQQFTASAAVLRPGGLLLVATPWSWLETYTDGDRWIGGRCDGPRSERALRDLLGRTCDLVAESDEAGVLRDHARHFEVFDADVTVWSKR